MGLAGCEQQAVCALAFAWMAFMCACSDIVHAFTYPAMAFSGARSKTGSKGLDR